MSSAPAKLFDRRRQVRNRARAAARFSAHDFLHQRVCADLADRLEAVNRRFERALILCDGHAMRDALAARPALSEKVTVLASADLTPAFKPDFVIDSETYPFADQSFDLIVSVLHLHWANDAPGALIQLRRALMPDGLLLAALFGGDTLHQLRTVLLEVESTFTGGAGLRINPPSALQDWAHLLQRAGFALPVADMDRIAVRYRDLLRLLGDLRGMGECAAFAEPAPPLSRSAWDAVLALYEQRYREADKKVPADFDVITLTGWAPHDSQQKPLRPGAAKARLADALGVKEQSAGEKAGD